MSNPAAPPPLNGRKAAPPAAQPAGPALDAAFDSSALRAPLDEPDGVAEPAAGAAPADADEQAHEEWCYEMDAFLADTEAEADEAQK